MAVKKATVDSTMAKVEAAKAAETKVTGVKPAAKKTVAKKAEPAKETKTAAKKAEPAKETKTVAKKAEPAKETKAAAKKAEPAKETKTVAKKAEPAKKTVAKKETTTNVVIEYAGGQVSTADIVAKAAAISGKKAVKNLNVYYQPENGMVYFTADGEEGSFAL